jgi:hypothetical protein
MNAQDRADKYAKAKGSNWIAKNIGDSEKGKVFCVFKVDRMARTSSDSHHVIVTDKGKLIK